VFLCMSKDSIALIVDALHRLETKCDKLSEDLITNTNETRDLSSAYARLAPSVEAINLMNTRITTLEIKHEDFKSSMGTAFKIGGSVAAFIFSGFWLANTWYIDRRIQETNSNTRNVFFPPQAILNDNRLAIIENKEKSKK